MTGRKLRQIHFYWLLAAIMLAALVLRLAVCWELAAVNGGNNAVLNPSPFTDMCTYRQLAEEVATGQFHTEYDYQPFYYAVFLAGLRVVFGDAAVVVWCAQSLLGALTVGFAGLLGARLAGRLAGVVAAVLTAFATTLVLYTPFHLIVTLQAFWVTALLWLTIQAADRRQWRWHLAAGLVCGCAILTRGNIYFLLPAVLLNAYIRAPGRGRARQLACAAATLALVFAVQLPFIWRNTMLKGELTGASTASGKVLALGNTPEAPPGGRNPGLPAGPMEYPPSWHSWMATEASRPVPQRILEWALAEPGAFLELNFRKALLFLDYREIPNNIGFHVDEAYRPYRGEADQSFWLQLAWVPTGLLLAGGIAGVLLSCQRRTRGRMAFRLAVYWVLAYWLGTAAFYILARFRAPLLPLLAVFTGIFVQHLWRLSRRKQLRKRWLYWGLALLAGVFAAWFANDFYRTNLEAAVLRAVRPDGVREIMADGRLMALDNGPASFGNWGTLELKPGMTLEKEFSQVPEQPRNGTLELTFAAATPGTLVLEVNGRREVLQFPRPTTETRTIELTGAALNRWTLRVLAVTGSIHLIADYQRDYGRTRLNGEPLGAELVARLYIAAP